MDSENETFDSWAIVEIMGHSRFAGHVTEQQIGGSSLVRVDVPASGETPAFTKLFGPSAIYCISPCTEETARRMVALFESRPFAMYSLPMLPPDVDSVDGDDEYEPNAICG